MKAKLDKAGYPSTWPILEAKDIFKGALFRGRQRCLMGWKNMALCGKPYSPDGNNELHNDVSRKIFAALETAANHLHASNSHGGLPAITDSSRNSTALLARIWNLTGAILDYVVDNPEAKTLREMNAK